MEAAAKNAVTPLDDRERSALLNLLGDADPAIFAAVRDRLVSLGPNVCEWLRPHTLSSDAVVRRHVRSVIHHFESRDADHEFLAFCLRHGEDLDLEIGALKLAATTHPELNPAAYHALLDEFADELRGRINPDSEPRAQLAVVNEYLFGELGFSGNEESYFDPKNSYLNQVLDRRTGNPISLCLIYLLLARRLKMPVSGIGLPGHFVCRYQSSQDSVYIDAFDRGRLLTKTDCVQYLIHSAFGLHEQFLTPVAPRRWLMRMCGNLHQSYLHLEQESDATRMQGYIMALSRQGTA
jgi:regulator of sirC expression with transglutaminase-like and TPR domain